MNKITAYKTHDGQIFEDDYQAILHEAETDLSDALDQFFDSNASLSKLLFNDFTTFCQFFQIHHEVVKAYLEAIS